MTWEIFVGLLAAVGALVGLVAPIIKLSANIAKLNINIITMTETIKGISAKTDSNEDSIHALDIKTTQHELKIQDHEKRISSLEKKD